MLAVITATSLVFYRPWCRLACPFGAIASVTSRGSAWKLRRNDSCTSCGVCEKVCPTGEAGKDASKAECYLCNRCFDACPVDAIEFMRHPAPGRAKGKEA